MVKPTFGLTGTPEIVERIERTGRRTAVLVGFETDVCVAQSAVGLKELGMRVVAVEDAVFSPGGDARPRTGADGERGSRAEPLQGARLRVDADAGESRSVLHDPEVGEAPFRL